jgi:ATPase components of ABC transporters with duplicated ATPase domains
MPNLIAAESISLALGTNQVLDGVSLGIGTGDRIGVVGRNGGGKSTLLRVLAGTQPVDSGRVTNVGGLTLGMLSQDDRLDPEATVRDATLGDRVEHEWAGDPRVRDILGGLLGGLGFAALGGPDAVVGTKSGGERRRIALAKLLIDDPDLLFLDEPTNHLDVEGVQWLADHLVQRRARADNAFVTITHDRWFLDAVADRTWEVVDGRIEQYDGGYAAYVLAKNERARVAAATEDRRQNLLRKELAWLRRGPPARTSKPRFRIDAANELIKNEPDPRDEVELVRFATTRLGKDVIDLIDATVRLGDRALLDNQTWRLAPGERTGIVGVNGAGKSTVLRAIEGSRPLDAGKRKQGKTVELAFLTQEVRELERYDGLRVIDAITEVKSFIMLGGKEVSASSLAKRLGFSGPRQQTRVGDLSGGERRRLQILRLLMTEPNVLLLDEPTNDLDIETLTSLEDVLDGWAGTLVVVSHDRYLLERMCDRQIALMGDGKLRELPGGVEQYLELHAAAKQSAVAAPSVAAARGPVSSAAEQREARKEMARIERTLSKLATQEEKLHSAMVEAATDPVRATELDGQLREVHSQREELEERWMEVGELVE